MQTPTRPAWLALAWLAACIPPDPPEHVVSYPITWGISASVVRAGAYGQDLEVAPGRARAEVLPDDTFELQWFGAAPEGAHIRPPIWLLTYAGFSPFILDGGVPPCKQPLDDIESFCRLGEGERVQIQLSPTSARTRLNQQFIRLIAIASDGDVVEPEACLQRAFSERNPDLAGCLIATRSVAIGPLWRVFQINPPIDLSKLPDAFFGVPANTNPVIEALHVERDSAAGKTTQIAASGDRISVRPGDRVTVTLQLDAPQDYVGFYKNSEDIYFARWKTEDLSVEARLNMIVDDYQRSEDARTHSWTAPDTPEPVTFFVQVDDNRHDDNGNGGSFGFATLRFVSTPADGDAP